jgi:hypothetical protein
MLALTDTTAGLSAKPKTAVYWNVVLRPDPQLISTGILDFPLARALRLTFGAAGGVSTSSTPS